MNKVVKNEMVAVLVSPKYGSGWYSWNKNCPECLFDPAVVAWVEGGKEGPCPDMGENFCHRGSEDLMIEWIPVGTTFRIEEHDGYEWVLTSETYGWHTA